jgi:hypothetical protein
MPTKVGTPGTTRDDQSPILNIGHEEVEHDPVGQPALGIFPFRLPLDGRPLIHDGTTVWVGDQLIAEEAREYNLGCAHHFQIADHRPSPTH